ncbi:hypothetical protein OG563_23855 [Nocardia vinacea]|uniref:ESX-1 secretion-associated protein EspA/EspE-like domain-containing protein n=1 Tax=Nocardia vinacea TaxID=96468 RepID=A0ABZ1YJ23_9NOCA|nr:hypothetical protein [Nocardia vinacea]
MTGLDINDVPSALGAFDSSRKPDTTQPSALARGQQQGAEQYETKLAADGQDPAYITRMEQFEGHTHEEIYTNAQQMSPGIMHHQADTWISIATALSGGLFGANIAIQKALASGIEGAMADAALAAAQTFYRQASDVEQVINACGHRIKGVASAAEVVKMTVPPPSAAQGSRGSATSLDPAQVIISAVGAGLVGDGDSQEVAYQRGIEALHRTAIDTMNNNYKPSYGPAGSGVPTFVPVTSPGGGNEGGTGPGGGNGGGNGGTTGSGTGNTGGSNGESNGSGTSGSDQGTVNPTGLDSNSTTGQQTQSPTTAASTTATSPAATTTAPTTSGQPGSLGSSGSGGTSGLGGSTTSSPGRSVTGVPTVGNSSAATVSTAATSAASAGRNGMSGMGSPGAGRKSGEDESNRKVPDYLIGQYEELLGPDDPAVPSLIGADAPSAQPSGERG